MNADAYIADEAAGLFAVVDAMGDTPRSAEVGRLALDSIRELFLAPWSELPFAKRWASEAADRLRLGVMQANGRLHVKGRPEPRRIGTTFAGAVVCRDHLCVGSIGDSRIYLFRPAAARIALLTQDDTLFNAALWRGVRYDVAITQPKAHALTRAIGLTSTLELRPAVTRWEPGDVAVVCTDGVTDWLDAAAIARTLASTHDLEGAAAQLVDEALAAGGWDNASAVLVRRAP